MESIHDSQDSDIWVCNKIISDEKNNYKHRKEQSSDNLVIKSDEHGQRAMILLGKTKEMKLSYNDLFLNKVLPNVYLLQHHNNVSLLIFFKQFKLPCTKKKCI